MAAHHSALLRTAFRSVIVAFRIAPPSRKLYGMPAAAAGAEIGALTVRQADR
jgi:hypothetical protein